MKEIKIFKNTLYILIGLAFGSIMVITVNLINETENWKFFGIDFANKDAIVSSYGALIGGVLSFLSILFVLISLLEQRQQVLREKQELVDVEKNELLDKLKLLSSFFKSSIDNIVLQGEEMKKFYIPEKEFPSTMNKMYFTTNKNFTRVIDLDPSHIYKAINMYFGQTSDWEKMFLNIYSIFDFYSEALKDLKVKYESQINFKVKEQRKISENLKKLLNNGAYLVDEYKINKGTEYLSYPWSNLMNEFTPLYYGYLDECKKRKEPTSLRFVSDNLLSPFLQTAMKIRNDFGYDVYGSRTIVHLTSDIRKRINEVEAHCKNYAEDIEYHYLNSFAEKNENLLKLDEYKQKMDLIINNVNLQFTSSDNTDLGTS
jgi:large-conductance mechanosensitive channel